MTTRTLKSADVTALLADIINSGARLVAPIHVGSPPYETLNYGLVKEPSKAILGKALPVRSLKELFLPPTDVLLSYKLKKCEVELTEVPTSFEPVVVFGAHPCDAAAPGIVDKVMNWDYHDELWNGRRDATTIVSIACDGIDSSCFCMAVGLAPDATRGSDLLLTPTSDGYFVDVITPKGEAFVATYESRFSTEAKNQEALDYRNQARAKVEKNLARIETGIGHWLKQNFENPYFTSVALRCHGCSACARLCPTCHCFDIVDEPSRFDSGLRRRNWDACQTARFTVHGSGHNPRSNQSTRFRQRLSHKFSIYPERFGDVLCTGCGRCVRSCPAGMDLPQILADVGEMSKNLAQGAE
jgi:ferredoxin